MTADPDDDVPFLLKGIMRKYEKNVKKSSFFRKLFAYFFDF
jgi:hypothetical protein